MPIVPNRANHPKRGNHYEVAHNTWEGIGPSATQFFSDKKTAGNYAKGISKLGYNVSVVKHSPASQDAGYTGGKVDHLMETKASLQKFFGPNPY